MNADQRLQKSFSALFSEGRDLVRLTTKRAIGTFFKVLVGYSFVIFLANNIIYLLQDDRNLWASFCSVWIGIVGAGILAVFTSWYRALGTATEHVIRQMGLGSEIAQQLITPIFSEKVHPQSLNGLAPKEARSRLGEAVDGRLQSLKKGSLQERLLRRILKFACTVFFWGVVREATDKSEGRSLVCFELLEEKIADGIDGLLIDYVQAFIANITRRFRITFAVTVSLTTLALALF